MSTPLFPVMTLSEMANGQEGDVFALLSGKEELTTRDGKKYFKVSFRDSKREVSFPIWADSAWAADCRQQWAPGTCYKLRATYRDTAYGPQLEIRKIRAVSESDSAEGFDPGQFQPRSRFNCEAMFDELMAIASERIAHAGLRGLVTDIYQLHRPTLLTLPAATRNHHTYIGGYLEHVLSVTRTCVYFVDKYDDYYPELAPKLYKDVAIAGAILHDIGKLHEIESQPEGAAYTAAGHLIGHILQGRDIVREAAVGRGIESELLLRLEHIIVSHQRLPEWGSPKPPMTPEALLVHYADDLDAKYNMMFSTLRDDATPGPLTSSKNQLYQKVFRGGSK